MKRRISAGAHIESTKAQSAVASRSSYSPQKAYLADNCIVLGELPGDKPTLSTVPGSATPNNELLMRALAG